MLFLRPALLAALMLTVLPARAVTVLVTYALEEGSASIDPISVPNPQGGEPLTITPALVIDDGSFEGIFENGTPLGAVSDGPATIREMNFTGSIAIAISTIVQLGPISVPVTADLTGPLTGTQVSDSPGDIIGGGTVFNTTEPGNFNVTAGPLECSDGALGVVCTLLETALGLSFPIEIPAVDNGPLPFAGVFSGLDAPGSSSVSTTLDFSVPIDDTNSFGVAVDILWVESGRALVPEPSPAIFASVALLLLSLRRRRAGSS